MNSLPVVNSTAAADPGSRGQVLFIVPQPFLAQRGSPLRVQATLRALVDLGYTVHLLAFPFGDNCNIAGVTVHRSLKLPWVREVLIGPSWTKFLMDLLLFFSALSLVFRLKPAVIHGIEEGGVIGACLGRLWDIPYVFDMHSHMSRQIRDRHFLGSRPLALAVAWLERLCIKRAAAVITVSDEITEHVRKTAPAVPSSTISDLPLESAGYVDWQLLAKFKQQYDLNGRKVILYTGNFDPYQGITLLLQGFAEFIKAQNNPAAENARLLIVGGGIGEDERKKLHQSEMESLGISARVIFTGSRPTDEMGTFMGLADVLVSPRVAGNNTPLKVYSYMASGKPMVATNITSHTQVLDDTCAILCDPTPAALAAKLSFGLDASGAAAAERAKMAAAARAILAERFSPERFKELIGDLYRQAVKGCCGRCHSEHAAR